MLSYYGASALTELFLHGITQHIVTLNVKKFLHDGTMGDKTRTSMHW